MFEQVGAPSSARTGNEGASDRPAHDASGQRALVPGRHTRAAPGRALVQQRSAGAGAGETRSDDVHAAAARGVATPSTSLPFGSTIQRLFGRHDISAIQAHVGPEAAASAGAMGAQAYATGHHVVLGTGTDLHTVAHEAAHVVQQRAGVHLQSGVGAVGDRHEQHADAVADRVVRGESAETLLDACAGGAAGGAPVVQRLWMDRRTVKRQRQQLWEQQPGDKERRTDGWYREGGDDEDDWVLVEAVRKEMDLETSKKRRHESPAPKGSSSAKPDSDREKDQDKEKEKDQGKPKTDERSKKQRTRTKSASTATESTEKDKAAALDPKIKKAPGSIRDALTLVRDGEIGQRAYDSALAASQALEFTIRDARTATHMDYDGDRQGTDTINVELGRSMKTGSVAQQLIMELTNLSNKDRFWETDYDAQNGALGVEDYVKVNEHIEYEATKRVYGAWLAAQDTPAAAAWGPSNHKDPKTLESWEAWWDHMEKKNPKHLQWYRDGWMRLCKQGAAKIPVPPSRRSAPSTAPKPSAVPTKPTQPPPTIASTTTPSKGGLVGYSDDEDEDDPAPTSSGGLVNYADDGTD